MIKISYRDITADWDDFSERYEKEGSEVVRQFLSGKKSLVRWRKVPASRLKKIWSDYAKFGFVRDESGLNDIAESILDGIARLSFSTEIMGHSEMNPREILERFGYELSDEQIEKFGDFLSDKSGNWYLSDYGLAPLLKIYPKILSASNAEQKLIAVDMALNVAHQRSDLSQFFIEGGFNTLEELKNQNTDQDEQEQIQQYAGLKFSQRDSWILFLDDKRNPKDGRPWTVARNVQEAKDLVLQRGMPKYISFDHDLEPEPKPNGFQFAKWLTEMDMDGKIEIPLDFAWNVHSANPDGAKNIQGILNSYMAHKNREANQ